MARLIRKKNKADGRKKLRTEFQPSQANGVQSTDAQTATANATTVVKPVIKRDPLPQKPLTHVKTPLESRKQNIIQKGLQFLREVKVEFKKVTWPSRKQTVGSTAVVLILVLIISAFLGVIDIGLSSLIDLLL